MLTMLPDVWAANIRATDPNLTLQTLVFISAAIYNDDTQDMLPKAM